MIIASTLLITRAFTLADDQGIAKVERVEGIYVFVMSEPVSDYEVAGTVKGNAVGSHEFDKLLGQLIKKTKKNYPDADGVLFEGAIQQSHNTKVSVIKLK